jgi:glycerol kinase
VDKRFEPTWTDEARRAKRARWAEAVSRSKAWATAS